MILYSQRDSRWAQKLVGASGLPLGRIGCTITDIAVLSTYFGDNLLPNQVCDKLKFTPNGLILWASCKFPHFKFQTREYGRNDLNIKAALKDPDRAVILQVANGSHWVVATSIKTANSVYNIADPWDGSRADMTRYKNSITGAAYFQRA